MEIAIELREQVELSIGPAGSHSSCKGGPSEEELDQQLKIASATIRGIGGCFVVYKDQGSLSVRATFRADGIRSDLDHKAEEL